MWQLDHKKAECQRIDTFKLWCCRKLFESPLAGQQIKQVNPKRNHLEYVLEGLMLKLKLKHFGHLMRGADLLEKTLMLGKIEGTMRRGRQGMRWLDSIINSMDKSSIKLHEMAEDKGSWHPIVHGVTRSPTGPSNWTTTTNFNSRSTFTIFRENPWLI